DVLVREIGEGVQRFEIALELVEVAACGVELGFGLRECERERLAVETEQLVAGIDVLAFADSDIDDLAGNVRSDQNLLRADIGIVGGNVASAGKIDAQADDKNERRQADKEDRAQTLASDPRKQTFCARRF